MVDIIDVILAKGATPQGQIESYAAMAQAAVTKANAAVAAANQAVNNIDTITQQTNTNNENAATALENAQQALEDAQDAIDALDDVGGVIDDEIDKLELRLLTNVVVEGEKKTSKRLQVIYPSGATDNVGTMTTYYEQDGNNTDGTMTQKAIKTYVESVKAQLQAAIDAIPSGGGSGGGGGGDMPDLGPQNAGNIVVVSDTGSIEAGDITEDEIIEALINSGSYKLKDTVGLDVDYENKTNERTQEAAYYTMGSDFDKYTMYGGRMRCNVADDGSINAFYGDNNYSENGSNGQVMIYQPKFYYKRYPIKTVNGKIGKILRKESILISPTKQPGFKIHPLFVDANGNELDYVFLPAFDGSLYDISAQTYLTRDNVTIDFEEDRLSSVGGVKPISGITNNFTVANAERIANNRGTGWHITNMAAESACQMLEAVEFGSLNGQASLEEGICQIPNNSSANCASLTGSTSAIGNGTGHADETINETNGTMTTYNTAGRRAICYRGMENPWGNIWHYVGGTNLYGNGQLNGGELYICNNFDYDTTATTGNYEGVGFCIPSVYNWVSGLGWGNEKYDWVFAPAECSSVASSAVPVGDNLWSIANLNAMNCILVGGSWPFELANGPFYYACDRGINEYGRNTGAKLMFIPTKNTIYHNNIALWQQKMEG